jgi:pheromone shutdown-related protein TraB
LKEKEFKVNLKELQFVPKKRFNILKIIGYAIPIIFILLIIYAFITSGFDLAAEIFIYWFLINGSFSAIGTAIARGHPFSIATAFVAAPITSLNPAIAAGWVAGYVEAKLRMPVIKDFQNLGKIDSLRDFWNNRVIRLLMVVALANVGSMIGTFVALPYLLNLGFGG